MISREERRGEERIVERRVKFHEYMYVHSNLNSYRLLSVFPQSIYPPTASVHVQYTIL